MKITLGSTVLASDAAAPRVQAQIEDWGVEGEVQEELLAFGAHPVQIPRGNVRGPFTLITWASYSTRALALTAVQTAFGLVLTQDDLTIEEPTGTAVVVMAGAVLAGVKKVEWNGCYIKLRYTFRVTTVAAAPAPPPHDSPSP